MRPEEPEAEEHAVEEVFEYLFVQEIEELRMMLNDHINQRDTEYIEEIGAHKA